MTLCITLGAWRGFIRTVLGFASFILAIFLTNLLYPHMGRFLRSIDGLYTSLSTSISRMLGLEGIIERSAYAAEYEIINALPLPAAFRDALATNNLPSVRDALNAAAIDEYISGFLAGIVINIISLVIVFILVFVALIFAARILNLISKLPVINSLNKFLGGLLGAVWGLLLTWIILAIVVIYFSANSNADMVSLLETSAIARPMHEANFVVDFVLRLFP